MVDLVKIRKKVKERKERAASEALLRSSEPVPSLAAPTGGEPLSPLPAIPTPAAAMENPIVASEALRVLTEAAVSPAARGKLEKFKESAGKRVQESMVVELSEAASRLELLTFTLAGEQYAIDIEKIVEIVPPRPATRVPNAAGTIVGIISLRGTIVTILDVRRKLGHPPAAEVGPDARIIVVEQEGEIAGFLVDRVWRKIAIDPSELENHPVVNSSEQSQYIRGVFQHGAGLSILLDMEALFERHDKVRRSSTS